MQRGFVPSSRRLPPCPSLLVASMIGLVGALLCSACSVGPIDPPDWFSSQAPGYWHTSGTSIRDSEGRRVRIAAVTWSGMDSDHWVPAGLDYQPYRKIMDMVKGLGYNAIRLPFSNQLVESNPFVTQYIGANPQFRKLHALQVMDAIVNYARRIGLKIILDDHRSAAASGNEMSRLREPLWYAAGYPESTWIRDWQFLALRFRHNHAVIGFDLRNEPHTVGPGPWSVKTYLTQGATWGPYEGVDDPTTDWRLAAERAGDAVLAINPNLLIFVEGVELYPGQGMSGGVDAYWWGSILTPVERYPVVLNVPHQLVYSPHEYGPDKVDFSWFRHMTYRSLVRVWNHHWGFILKHPNAPHAAPIWIGETGACTNYPGCVRRRLPGNEATWLHYFLRFLRSHPNVGWCVWDLNGTNANDHPTTDGILNPQWDGVASWKLQKLWESVQH